MTNDIYGTEPIVLTGLPEGCVLHILALSAKGQIRPQAENARFQILLPFIRPIRGAYPSGSRCAPVQIPSWGFVRERWG